MPLNSFTVFMPHPSAFTVVLIFWEGTHNGMSVFERGTHFQFNWLLPIEADSFALACLLSERRPHLFILPSCKMLFDEIVVRSANECTQQIIKCLPVCHATEVFKMKTFQEAFFSPSSIIQTDKIPHTITAKTFKDNPSQWYDFQKDQKLHSLPFCSWFKTSVWSVCLLAEVGQCPCAGSSNYTTSAVGRRLSSP